MEAGTQYKIPKPGRWERKRKKSLLTAMCQASETSEWKGSVGKEVAESTIKPGKRARKASSEEKRPVCLEPVFLAQQSVAHADSGEATQRPS